MKVISSEHTTLPYFLFSPVINNNKMTEAQTCAIGSGNDV